MFQPIRDNLAAQMRLGCVLVLLLACSAPTLHSATIVIDEDTVIDADNSFPETNVEIQAGPNGSPNVELAAGGEIGYRVKVRDASTLTLTGGEIGIAAHVSDDARLVMFDGSITCISAACAGIEVDSLLSASGNAEIHLYGGVLLGPVDLRDASVAHLYGPDLQFRNDPGAMEGSGGTLKVDGRLINGTLDASVEFVAFGEARVVLHRIPEPTSFTLILPTAIALTTFNRTSRRKRTRR